MAATARRSGSCVFAGVLLRIVPLVAYGVSTNLKRIPMTAQPHAKAVEAAMVATTEPEQIASIGLSNQWYAIGYTDHVGRDEPFATRLWGEPLVLYRDASNELTCVADLCPHRSAPLSMGEMENGELRCFYHGWAFGPKGVCTDVPTIPAVEGKRPNLSSFCATSYAVTEHDGLIWVWKGELLAADASKLPRAYADPKYALVVNTTLDYALDWTVLVESRLCAPHLPSLHEGALADALATTGERGYCGADDAPHLDALNIVRYDNGRGSDEEVHVQPVAPGRTRVLLRQRLQRTPALSALLALPGGEALLVSTVRHANYRAALDDARQGFEGDAAAEALSGGGAESTNPRLLAFKQQSERVSFFAGWGKRAASQAGSRYGTQQQDESAGTYGLKRNYVQRTPAPAYAPMKVDDTSLTSLIQRSKEAQEALAAAAISLPAAVLTYKTVGAAFASSVIGGPS